MLLFLAGLVAGALNAGAGGGSFVSFPAMVFAGLPSVAANASSTVALFPGAVASVWAFRTDFTDFGGVSLRTLIWTSVVGGIAGAMLLLWTPSRTFDWVVPWLLLLATFALIFGRQAGNALRRVVQIGPGTLVVAQFVLAVYCGYFGGAAGLMMMAAWNLLRTAELKAMMPAKALVVGATNLVAVVCFIIADKVSWPETLVMLVGAAIGGYVGARVARRMDPRHIRIGVIVLTIGMTAAFFLRAYTT